MKKLSILSMIIILFSLSSCVFFVNYDIYVDVDYEWIQSGDYVYIDYTIYNRGNITLENVIVEFGADTENNNDFDGILDIREWTNPVNLEKYESQSEYNFRIPLYGDTVYGVGLLAIAMDNPPDED